MCFWCFEKWNPKPISLSLRNTFIKLDLLVIPIFETRQASIVVASHVWWLWKPDIAFDCCCAFFCWRSFTDNINVSPDPFVHTTCISAVERGLRIHYSPWPLSRNGQLMIRRTLSNACWVIYWLMVVTEWGMPFSTTFQMNDNYRCEDSFLYCLHVICFNVLLFLILIFALSVSLSLSLLRVLLLSNYLIARSCRCIFVK